MAMKNNLKLMKIKLLHFIDQENGKEKNEIKIKKIKLEIGSKTGVMNTNYSFRVLQMESLRK